MEDFEPRLAMIAEKVWSIWTCDGRGLDEDMVYQTKRSAQDAANNAYLDDMSDEDWTFAACMYFLKY
jgi:hypothetical protein